MSVEYPILEEKDFDEMVKKFRAYFAKTALEGKDFKKFKLVTKQFRKSKTPPQHRMYFACINDLKKAFEEVGYRFNQEQLHHLMKQECGLIKMVEMPSGKNVMMMKSIADISEDATCDNMRFLIDFVIEYAALNLNYEIKVRDL